MNVYFIIDDNECLKNKGGCERFCHNTVGSFYCTCDTGYKIDTADNKTCIGE